MTSIKLCVVGATAVGKTSFMLFLKDGTFPDPPPKEGEIQPFTINVDVSGTTVELNCTDTGSSEVDDRRRPMMKYSGTDIFLVCFSYADEASLKKVPLYVKEMLHHSPGTPIYMVGFKSDLDDKTITQDQIDQIVKQSKTHVGEVAKSFSVCCKTNQGVQELLKEACAEGLKYHQKENPTTTGSTAKGGKTDKAAQAGSSGDRRRCTLF